MPPRKKEPLGVATLEDIGRLILHSHDLDETLRNVAELVARRAGTEVCSIYLLEEDGRTLVLRASHGLAKRAVGKVRMSIDEGLTGLVARERRVVAVREPQEHPLYRHFKETGEERFHSFFGVPLLDRGEPVGVLVLQTREPRDFTAEETSALSSIAYQVAAIGQRHALVEPEEVVLLRVEPERLELLRGRLLLDDDRDVLHRGGEFVRQVGERLADQLLKLAAVDADRHDPGIMPACRPGRKSRSASRRSRTSAA